MIKSLCSVTIRIGGAYVDEVDRGGAVGIDDSVRDAQTVRFGRMALVAGVGPTVPDRGVGGVYWVRRAVYDVGVQGQNVSRVSGLCPLRPRHQRYADMMSGW